MRITNQGRNRHACWQRTATDGFAIDCLRRFNGRQCCGRNAKKIENFRVPIERVQIKDGMPAYWRLQGPNQWPSQLPGFRDTILKYQAAVTDLAIRMLHLFAEALHARWSQRHHTATFALLQYTEMSHALWEDAAFLVGFFETA